jgi:hypothetical protein
MPYIAANFGAASQTESHKIYDQVYSVDKVSSGWKVSRTNNILHETPDVDGSYSRYSAKEIISIRFTGDLDSDAISPRIETISSEGSHTDKFPGGLISDINKYFTIVTTFSEDKPLPIDFTLAVGSRMVSNHPDYDGSSNGNTHQGVYGNEGSVVRQNAWLRGSSLPIYDGMWQGPSAGDSQRLLKPSHINGIPLFDENGNLYSRHAGSRNPRSGLSSRDKGKIVSITWDLSRQSGGGYDGIPERNIGGYLNPTNISVTGRGNGAAYSHIEDPVYGFGGNGDGIWNSNFWDGTVGGPSGATASRPGGYFRPSVASEPDPETGLVHTLERGVGIDISHRYAANVAAPYGSGGGISVSGGLPFLANTLFTSVSTISLCTMKNYGPGTVVEDWIDPDNIYSGGHPEFGVGATATSNNLNCEFILHAMLAGPGPPSIRTLPVMYSPGGGIGSGSGSFKSATIGTGNTATGNTKDLSIPAVVHVNALSYYTSRKNSDGNYYGIRFPEDYISEGLEGTSKDPFAGLRTGAGPIDYTDGPIFIIFEIPEGMNIGANTSGNYGSHILGAVGAFTGARYELRSVWDSSWTGSAGSGAYLSDPSLIINLNSNLFKSYALHDLHITIVNRGNTIGAGGSGGYGSRAGIGLKLGGGGGGSGQGLHPTWPGGTSHEWTDNFGNGDWGAGQAGSGYKVGQAGGGASGIQGTINTFGAAGAVGISDPGAGGPATPGVGHSGGSAIYVQCNTYISNTSYPLLGTNINIINMPTGRMYGGGGGGYGGHSVAGAAGGSMSNTVQGTSGGSTSAVQLGGWQGSILWVDSANLAVSNTITNHNSDFTIVGWDGTWA